MNTLILHPDFRHLEDFVRSLPQRFSRGEGTLIHDGRNQLRTFTHQGLRLVVKSYKIPHLLNRLVYGTLRSGKAQRAYEYALLLRQKGFGSPQPVAWSAHRTAGLLFGHSYFVSLESECPYTYAHLMAHRIPREEEVLQAIGRLTARLHNQGMIHTDYSRGNILIGFAPDGTIRLELIDLNRLRFHPISIEEGLQNLFERLPADHKQRTLMQSAYLAERETV